MKEPLNNKKESADYKEGESVYNQTADDGVYPY